MLLTFGLTVAVDLTVAIEVGIVTAMFLFMRRMSEVTNVGAVTREFGAPREEDETDADRARRRRLHPGVEIYEINGPFFFRAAEKFKDTLAAVARNPKVLIIRLRNVPAIDSTGLNAFKDLVRRTRHEGTLVLLSDVQPMVALGRSALLDELGEENVFGDIDAALDRAAAYVRD